MDTPRTATITMRVRNALKKRLEKMARSTGRSRSYLGAARYEGRLWRISRSTKIGRRGRGFWMRRSCGLDAAFITDVG
jgi:hypothetical protein